MVVNFRARGISRGARKLARTPTLIYIKKKKKQRGTKQSTNQNKKKTKTRKKGGRKGDRRQQGSVFLALPWSQNTSK
jgi:hypothetical protein